MILTFTILLTYSDGRTETVTEDHSLARYAVLHAKQAHGAKSGKVISRKASTNQEQFRRTEAPKVTPEQNALWRKLTGVDFN